MAKSKKPAGPPPPMLFEVEAKATFRVDVPQKEKDQSLSKPTIDVENLGLRGGKDFGDYIANGRNNTIK